MSFILTAKDLSFFDAEGNIKLESGAFEIDRPAGLEAKSRAEAFQRNTFAAAFDPAANRARIRRVDMGGNETDQPICLVIIYFDRCRLLQSNEAGEIDRQYHARVQCESHLSRILPRHGPFEFDPVSDFHIYKHFLFLNVCLLPRIADPAVGRQLAAYLDRGTIRAAGK
ncbi:MAG: hypothetical protein ABJA02_14240 [Acidobacteriota bacterium]